MTRRLTRVQHDLLAAALTEGGGGIVDTRDRRTLSALDLAGLIAAEQYKPPRARELHTRWRVTDNGRRAFTTWPVREPTPRVVWGHRTRRQVNAHEWWVEGHRLYRIGRDSAWHVTCPHQDRDVAITDAGPVAVPVEELDLHLQASRDCPRVEPAPGVVDLDALVERNR